MKVIIGKVTTFPHPKANKVQAKKILEESAEVYGAWERAHICGCDVSNDCPNVNRLIAECADLITATCNLLAALGVDDMREAMHACEQRNRDRGRL